MSETLRRLREMTGAGLLDCKKALESAGGDLERAVRILREKGLALAAKKAGREASEGIIDAYIHPGSRLGVLVEVNCETDFVARTPEFREFVHEVAMQIAAMNPTYVSRDQVPPEVLEREKEILRVQAEAEGKPPQVAERIVQGRLEKFFAQACLLDQPYIRDGQVTVGQLLTQLVARVGENVVIRRFARFDLGEMS
ncbi:MAG: translation elongation factor Ts [Firmicutes bacterium]|nr:translation elongation factor Ts [Bacillota bacterium]MDI6823484.1 translation elongation factor Ts [Bacillota bacterium]MDI7248818.1 translation elongation factor Ts [Bacillota bacterium]